MSSQNRVLTTRKERHIINHRRSQGGQRGHGPPTCLENIAILRFERRFSEQNSVIRLKSNILSPPKFFD